MNKIEINKKDLEALKALDPVLSEYIDNSEMPIRYYDNSFFECVTKTLIGQLISKKAADSIYQNLKHLLKQVSAKNFIEKDKEEIINCGIYEKKYNQILTVAKDVKSGILDAQQLALSNDQKIVKTLCKYPGIGPWSAEMILLFGLKRKDILSFNDFGIRSGVKKVYDLKTLSKVDFEKIKKRLSPYGSLASLYFWQAHTKE